MKYKPKNAERSELMEKRELYIKGLTIGWDRVDKDSYIRTIPAVTSCNTLVFRKPVTCFVGENGSGKSTLLEAIAVAYGFNPEGGTRNYSFSTYDSHSELCDAIRLIKGAYRAGWGYFLRAESFYNVATREMDYADARHPSLRLHERSHGESFFAVAQRNFQPNGVYLLDEPEAALSPQRQLTLLAEIAHCAAAGSQFILVTHSPILLGMPDAEILSFDGKKIHPISYEETDSYRVTKMFLEDRKRLLHQLMYKEDED